MILPGLGGSSVTTGTPLSGRGCHVVSRMIYDPAICTTRGLTERSPAMSTTGTTGTAAAPTTERRELRRVAFATVIGTTIEWYDFFLYASAAGLVFGTLFFEPAGTSAATLLSFATVGISFLFRPLGAFLAGHFGDKIGRKAMLVVTLILMGSATTLIGVLPTYAQIGVLAPLLLVALRLLQGFGAGAEISGAGVMLAE